MYPAGLSTTLPSNAGKRSPPRVRFCLGMQAEPSGTCALALVQCRELNSHRVLIHLAPLLADKELSVRVNAVRAIEKVGTDSAARLRAELASDEPQLLGSCYSSVLALEGAAAIPWVSQFLAPEDDTAVEAALSIAQTYKPEAFQSCAPPSTAPATPGSELPTLSAISLTRPQQATDWLPRSHRGGTASRYRRPRGSLPFSPVSRRPRWPSATRQALQAVREASALD
jgi:hypothetical protein